MWTEHTAVTFGGKQTEAEILHFSSVAEATETLGPADVLGLINAAFRTRQLARIRQTLEHHKREVL